MVVIFVRPMYRPLEVAEALAQAGVKSQTPLRDRAVMLLASLLGLRSSDIKALRFEHSGDRGRSQQVRQFPDCALAAAGQ